MIKQEFTIERDVIPLPLNGSITVFNCRPIEPVTSTIVRKFKSECGNTLEVHITRRNGFIRCIKPLYDCQPDCASCADRIERIRKLIASEHKTH